MHLEPRVLELSSVLAGALTAKQEHPALFVPCAPQTEINKDLGCFYATSCTNIKPLLG